MEEVINDYNIIKSININNLSGLSKIHLSTIIESKIDLLNNHDNDEYCNILFDFEIIYNNYETYRNVWEDFHPISDESSVSFLTYINEEPNNYLSCDDVKVKILILKDFINTFDDYKNSKYFLTVDIQKITNYLNKWKKKYLLF